MHLLVGEVAPLAPLIVPLGELCALLFVLGCLYVLRAFIGALLGALGSVVSGIPFIGGITSGVIHSAEQKVSNALGSAVSAVEGKIGAAWHMLARIVDWLGHELASHAGLLWTLSRLLAGTATTALLQGAVAEIRRLVRGVEHNATTALHRIATTEKRLAHGIGEDVLPRLRALDREIDRVIGRDLPRVRAREAELERGAGRVWDWIRHHPRAVVSTAFVGAVAWALARMGAAWVRCHNWNRIGRTMCGTDAALIESLLADTLLIVGTLSLVEFAEAMIEVEDAIAVGIQEFWRAT